MNRQATHRRRDGDGRRAYVLGGLLLLLVMAGTWGARLWQAAQVSRAVPELQAEALAEAFAVIQADFAAMQERLRARADAVAALPVIQRGLLARTAESSPDFEALVRFVASLPVPQGQSLEVYGSGGRLLAWNGFSMPDTTPGEPLPRTLRTAVVSDDGIRRALVLWMPVQDATGLTYGALRLMHLVEYRAPVQNQYLRDASLARQWQLATGLPVEVRFEAEAPTEGEGAVRPLLGIDGAVLGQAIVQAPRPEAVRAAVAQRYGDVLALWSVLLFAWLVFGAWTWYRHAATVGARGLRFVLLTVLWWGGRYALLALDVPARWQSGRAPLNPLFDPTHFAAAIGNGLLRSMGDLLLTALFALGFGIAVLHFAVALRPPRRLRPGTSLVQAGVGALVAGVLGSGLGLGLAFVVRHAIFDSTLDYFSRTGLFPERLVLVIFCALLLLACAFLLAGVAVMWLAWVPTTARPVRVRIGILLLGLVPPFVGLIVWPSLAWVPWPAAISFLVVSLALAAYGHLWCPAVPALFTLRSVLVGAFLVTGLLYPLVFQGMAAKRAAQMEDVADSFDEGRDPRVYFAIRQVLEAALRMEPVVAEGGPLSLDQRAEGLLRGSFLASLDAYDATLTFLDAHGTPLGRHDEADPAARYAERVLLEADEFDLLREMHRQSGGSGLMIEPLTGRQDPTRLQYVGLAPVGGAGPVAWVLVRAEPRARFPTADTPFPRVLTPGGIFTKLRTSLSVAEFRDGVFVDGFGQDFGRYRLAEDVRQVLVTEQAVWRRDESEGRRYLTYYRRQEAPAPVAAGGGRATVAAPADLPVIAVRSPATGTFDHLYYLLRLTVAALLLGGPAYGVGLWLRRRVGLLPAPRTRFRDRVLNAFLGVGIVTVGAVGFAGVLNTTRETGEALSNILEQDLDRVERTLQQERRSGEPLYETLARLPLDSLAGWTGLDLLVYAADGRLQSSSQPRLVQNRLVDVRLPAAAYHALFFDGFRYVDVEAQVGAIQYRAGYRVLLGDDGRPRYVIAVPGIPDQERIEEERARQVAYVFSALLLLMVVVMLTAAIIASALARPIGRLRQGLKAAGKGQFEQTLPVYTTDEIGDLVRTFNEMQEQLAESRRQLAQQERQLAWREMARQVAHEIKNPLTPMKLSVQHLRRAFDPGLLTDADGQATRFVGLFERITGTLLEQVDALKRIADEFHSFARLPTRVVERLDLNAVIREAVALMQEESGASIEADLHAAPLPVEADREELRRVYINLLKNAIQAVPEDREGLVRVSTRLAPATDGASGWADSTVADNGAGIPPDLRDKIFEPNFSTKTSGTGLGLAITRKAVEDLRGTIDFETEPGLGTTFYLRLPLAADGDVAG